MKKAFFSCILFIFVHSTVFSDEPGFQYLNYDDDKNEIARNQAFINDDPKYLDYVQERIQSKDPEFQDRFLLHEAASALKINIVKALVEKGAKINQKDEILQTPLLSVSGLIIHDSDKENQRIQCDIAKLLLENGADINAVGGYDNHTGSNMRRNCLHEAACNENLELVKLLVDHGAKINAKDFQNETPLYKAVNNRRKNIAKYLLDKGADVSIKENYQSFTPLLKAVYADQKE